MNDTAPMKSHEALRATAVLPKAVLKTSICIATYRRPEQLHVLLGDLMRQHCQPQEVIVVDNDAAESARSTVEAIVASGAPFPIRYAVQAQKNIALTRNLTVALAQCEQLAFIDDDERAPPEWLERLLDTAMRFSADGVLGPVEPVLSATAPAWLRRGRFYHWQRMKTGTIIPLRLLRFGNVLLSAAVLRTQEPVFDPAYGLTGGEDGDLLSRLVQAGGRMIWCDEAIVSEPVAPSRLSLRWLLLRALRGGQDFARHVLAGRYGPPTAFRRTQLFLRALVQMLCASMLALLCLPLGLHLAAHWMVKAAANLGKLSCFLGWHYREYA